MLVIGTHLSAHTMMYQPLAHWWLRSRIGQIVCVQPHPCSWWRSFFINPQLSLYLLFHIQINTPNRKSVPCLCQEFTLCYSGDCRYLSLTKRSSFSPCLCSGHVAWITFFDPQQGYPREQWLQEWPHKAFSLYSTYCSPNIMWIDY